jgi:hypothetical protein
MNARVDVRIDVVDLGVERKFFMQSGQRVDGLTQMPDGRRVLLQEDMVLCKIYMKATPLKELEQRASAMEEMQRRSSAARAASLVQAAGSAGDDYLSVSSDDAHDSSFLQLPSSSSSAPSGDSYGAPAPREAKTEAADAMAITVASTSSMAAVQPPAVRHADLPTLQVPTNNLGVADWTQMQDPFQLRSPWQDQLFFSPLAHLLY